MRLHETADRYTARPAGSEGSEPSKAADDPAQKDRDEEKQQVASSGQAVLLLVLGIVLLGLGFQTKVPPYDPMSVLHPFYRYLRMSLFVGGICGIVLAFRLWMK